MKKHPQPNWTDGEPRCTLKCKHRKNRAFIWAPEAEKEAIANSDPLSRDYGRDVCTFLDEKYPHAIGTFHCGPALQIIFKTFRDLVNSKKLEEVRKIRTEAKKILKPYV